jgi:hypothetical protein
MVKKTIDDILNEADESGLLADLKPLPAATSSEEQRVRERFEEINKFIDRYGRPPGEGDEKGVSLQERTLKFALAGIKADERIVGILAKDDRHHILPSVPQPAIPVSLDDIIESDDDLLHTDADAIFIFDKAPQSPAQAERKAERHPAADFKKFKPLFDGCADDLKAGRRQTIEFKNEQEIKAGEFFILNGAMLYVAEVKDYHTRNGRSNARLRLIFDNGTEADNLLRSLAAQLYKDGSAGRGRRVTAGNDGPLFTGEPDLELRPSVTYADSKEADLSKNEFVTGIVYVLRSRSVEPAVAALQGRLFKIGFTTGSVEARVSAAKDDPTYLMAGVNLVKSFQVVNMNTVKLENLLHRFFAEARLDIEIVDRFGKSCRPREWFMVPLDVISKAIEKLIDGSIVNFRYDRETCDIVPR